MSNGFNVQTYQITKQDVGTGGTSGGISQDVLDRLAALEANQMNIYNTFTYDFDNDKYFDYYKSTVIKTSDGIIPRQVVDSIYLGLDNDDIIDYDNSDDIKWANGQITLSNTSTLVGTVTTFPINLNGAIGAKFDFNFTNKITPSGTSQTEMNNTNLWFVSEVDKYGRLWIISSEQFSTGATNKAHVNIFNKDGSLYKTFDLANKVLFGDDDATAAYPYFSGNMKFTDENVAVIVTRTHPSIRNGGNHEVTEYGTCTDKVVLLNESGMYNVIGSYSGYWVHSSYLFQYDAGSQADIMINNDVIYIQFGSYVSMMYRDGNQLNNRYRNFAAFQITGSLASALTNIRGVRQYFRGSMPRTTVWEPANYKYTAFRNSNVVFRPDGKDYYECFAPSKDCILDYTGNYINQIYSLQSGVNTKDNYIGSEASPTDINFTVLNALTNKIVNYSHPGFNGMFYASNGKLYIFGNDLSSKTALLNCYLPDWTSRPSGKLNVTNTISKTLNLQTNSLSIPNVDGLFPAASYPNAPLMNLFMKIIEFDNKLHLFYVAPTSDTIKRLCLKYMSFDFNLNQIIQETILWQQSTDTARLCDFDVTVFNNDLLVTCSVGDNNNVTVANTASKIYSIRISKVSSTVTFQYMDNVDKAWRNVTSGQEVLFNTPRDTVTIKAVLQSSTYNASPVIDSINISRWDNAGESSRLSEYYSNQIETVQNDGKGVLTADYELNDGAIVWYMSFNGGQDYVPVNLEEEFVYNQMQAPDFRIKAVMSVTDNAKKLPIVHSYTLKTSHVVLHSDLEEVQINLMKTNFKIDTYTNASKNGLLKMTIDTLSDESSIDMANSDYTYYPVNGCVSGNYIQTKPELVPGGVKTLLLTTEEDLDDSMPNSKILYYVSIDGGVTFKAVTPDVKLQVNNTNTTNDNLVMKAVFYDNAHLTAWGWAWD